MGEVLMTQEEEEEEEEAPAAPVSSAASYTPLNAPLPKHLPTLHGPSCAGGCGCCGGGANGGRIFMVFLPRPYA